jgi:hypothetical protein
VKSARLLALLAAFLLSSRHCGAAQDRPVLSSLAQVLNLTNDEASHEYPFRLRAQVTLFLPKAYLFFVQDGPIGIYSLAPNGAMIGPGDWIEAEGVTQRGSFAPILNMKKLRVVGHGELPRPFRFDDPTQKAPESVNIWSVGHGRIVNAELKVIGKYQFLNFDLRLKDNSDPAHPTLKLRMGSLAECDRAKLVDAEVVVHGVLGTLAVRETD